MKVKIEYDAEIKWYRYKVYAKNNCLRRWRRVENFETLQEAKDFARNLFDKSMSTLIYKNKTDIE